MARSDGEGRVSGQKCLEKTREPAQKAGISITSLWVRKNYILSQTSSVRVRDSQEQEKKKKKDYKTLT